MDIEHSAISTIQRLGYPDNEFLEWELRVANEEYTTDEEVWPDGVTHSEWQDMKKRSLGKVNAVVISGVE